LYYFEPTTFKIHPFGFLKLGIHKIDFTKTFEEVAFAEHNMRINRLIDLNDYLFVFYMCMCKGNETIHLGVYDKNKDEFYNLRDNNQQEKIINDMGGPDFKPSTCNTYNQIIGFVYPYECHDLKDFTKKYNIHDSDNPIIILANSKN
jgi:hypothetical protein